MKVISSQFWVYILNSLLSHLTIFLCEKFASYISVFCFFYRIRKNVIVTFCLTIVLIFFSELWVCFPIASYKVIIVLLLLRIEIFSKNDDFYILQFSLFSQIHRIISEFTSRNLLIYFSEFWVLYLAHLFLPQNEWRDEWIKVTATFYLTILIGFYNWIRILYIGFYISL